MSKKFRVLLSAFLSVVIATNSVYVMAAAESVDAFSLPASQADELAADSSAVNTSTSSKATLNTDVTEESDKASESEALIQEINEGRAKGTCANGIYWEIDTDLILTVSGTGEIGTELPWQRYAQVVEKIIISAGITEISDDAFPGFVATKSVVIGEDVTDIGNNAFYGCTSLASVTLKATGLASIGAGAFYDCTPLANFSIPETVNAIGDSAFAGCKKISSVVVPAGVTNLGNKVFYGCEALVTAVISKGVENIGEGTFAGCAALASVKFPSTLKSIGKQAFQGCSSLITINDNSEVMELPDSVASIGESSFAACNALKAVSIGGSITKISKNAFISCENLTKVNITGTAQNPIVIDEYAFSGTVSLDAVTLENVKTIGPYCFYKSALQSIALSDSVETIGKFAFAESLLTGIEISPSVKNVGESAFEKCLKLKSFSIKNPEAASVVFGKSAFANCTALEDIKLEGIYTFGQEMFKNCTSITEVDLPVSARESAAMVFSGCTNLTKATAKEGVVLIGPQMFYNCPITEFTIPESAIVCHNIFAEHKQIETVISKTPYLGEGAFKNCTSLTSVTLADTTREIGGASFQSRKSGFAFSGCTNLEKIVLPSSVNRINPSAFEGTAIKTISIPDGVDFLAAGIFKNCEQLESLEIVGDGVITSIGKEAFLNCISLTGIPSYNSTINIDQSAFSGCTGLTRIQIPDSVNSIGNSAFYGCVNVKEMIIPSGVTAISNQTFEGCAALEKVVLNGQITSIGSKAFYCCGNLKGFTIPSSVTSIGSDAFNGCTYLGKDSSGNDLEIELPAELTTINSGTFKDCINLNNITIGENVKSIGANAFSGCSSTKFDRISIPASVTTIGASAFEGCKNLSTVTIYDGDKSCTTIGTKAFYGCENLTSITVPTTLTNIQTSAFENCGRLKSILIQQNVETIGAGAFKNCKSLETAVLSASKIKTLSNEVFSGCTSLKSVQLPATVTSIGSKAFLDCVDLKDITIPGSVTSLGANSFEGCTSLETIVIPVPVKTFGKDAFKGCSSLTSAVILSMNTIPLSTPIFTDCNLTIFCYKNAPAIAYAEKYGFNYKLIKENDGVYIAILKQPTVEDHEIGDSVELNVRVASNGMPSYQWYYKMPGSSSFVEAAGETSSRYSFTLTEENNGVAVKCKITSVSTNGDSTVTDYTEEVVIAAIKAPVISSVDVTSESATISWNSTSNNVAYNVYRADSASGEKTLLNKVATTTYCDKSIIAGNTYYYFVTTYDSGINAESKYSSAGIAAIPTFPTKITAAPSDGTIDVSWSTVNGATKYRVYYNAEGSSSWPYKEAEGTSYTLTGLTNGKKYGIGISAFINGKWSNYKDNVVYATPGKIEKPAIIGIKPGENKVKLEWKATIGAEMYRVYTYENGAYTRRFTCDGTRTVATVTGLQADKKYGFVVSAKVNGAWTDYSDKADLVYATPTAPAVVKPAITAYKPGTYKVKLEWKAVPNAEMYRVYTYENGAYTRKFTCLGSRNIATVTGLVSGVKLGFVVSAKVNGTWTDYTDKADLVYATPTGDPAPVITGTKGGDGKVKLSWYAMSGAEMYRVYTYENGAYTRKFTCNGSTNVATVTGLTNGKEYGFVVSAKVNGVWTNYSVPELLIFATPNP